MRSILLALLLAVFLLSTAAATEVEDPLITNKTPLTLDAYAGQSVLQGFSFWNARNVQPCTPISTYLANLTHGALAAATRGGSNCEQAVLVFDRAFWYRNLELRNDPNEFWRRYSKRKLCTVIFHEMGHLGGVHHSDNPKSLMYPYFQGKDQIPNECKVLSRYPLFDMISDDDQI